MAVEALFEHPGVWRGDRHAQVPPGIPTGFADLDALLPGGGWALGTLTEIALQHHGIGEISLFLPALRRLTAAGEWVAFVTPPHLPYAPALEAGGIDLRHFLLIRAGTAQDRLWATEQALRAGSCSAVLFWPADEPDERSLRRLQLAAEEGRSLGVLFVRDRRQPRPSPAALKLRLEPAPDGRLRVHPVKRRAGGQAAPVSLPVEEAWVTRRRSPVSSPPR